jgi:putative ABC transport system substrate-binding protein
MVRLRRRQLLIAVGAIPLLAPQLGRGQQVGRVYRIASVGANREAPFLIALERRLKELGYVDGKNLAYEFRALLPGRWEKMPETAAEIARLRPDIVIVPGSEHALRAIRQAMQTTPIVMIAVDFDPVEKNFIASLARPGGNITGVFLRQIESAAKRLDLLKEAFPKVTRVAALFDLNTRDQYRAAEEGAKKLGIELLPYELRGDPYDFDGALAAAAAAKSQAVLALSSGSFFGLRHKWIAAAQKHRLPVIANPNYADAGAVVSFGASFPAMYARAAEYADRILKGAKPAELPVEQPTKFELVVNLKSARALKIAVAQSILLRADRVIE